MQAEIRGFEWPDLPGDRAAGRESALLWFTAGPPDRRTAGPPDRRTVGSAGRRGLPSDGLHGARARGMVDRDGVVIGRHLLIVENIVTERVEAVIGDRIRRIDATSWTELANKIGRIAYWEFEDHTPAS